MGIIKLDLANTITIALIAIASVYAAKTAASHFGWSFGASL